MKKQFCKLPFTDAILTGFGQIMLQENRWTGLFFLIGIFAGSWQCGIGALLASISGTAIAKLLNFESHLIQKGLYGFSAALVGVVLTFLFKDSWFIWLTIIAGGITASLLQHLFILKNFPAYTFPFVFVSWILIFLIRQYTNTAPSDLFQATIPKSSLDFISKGIRGFGQVIFQSQPWSGILFLAGVTISSPRGALYGFTASILGAFIAQIAGMPVHNIELGLFGFNAVLTAIVFSNKNDYKAIWAFIAVILTLIIHIGLIRSNVLNEVGGVLTFPFVAGTWLTLLLRNAFSSRIRGKI